ncbi:hypothetical protein OAO01_00135 [Oligoflexia bacterium]|nr:hypothetical protein [Oligoflexia bacterium]
MDWTNLDKRAWAKGLAMECPMNEELSDCPLCEVRRLPLAQRVKVVDNMSDADIDNLLEQHIACLKKREAENK